MIVYAAHVIANTADLDECKGLVHYGAVVCGGAALDKNNVME